MKLIPTKVHGVLDYLTGGFLIASPWIFGLNPAETEGRILIVMGILAIVYSIFTNYEFGLLKIIPMKIHLFLDVLSGVLLAASPWLLDFHEVSYKPHVFIGLFEIAAGLLTQPKAWAKDMVR